ncbi:hypothetical protein [Nguyenibacter vanlangensis]|uniref:Uncharacterized protein n=1 Tax=Nguyenibacter vanlangensis TaxID=1216886 RepID=A0A7Y7IUB5_9PROT|nr:hypothetical protein [Nguyenibacter vanlangensis]NVN10533.1 hypothetical protein [Nguyenibacter vanlangensis]
MTEPFRHFISNQKQYNVRLEIKYVYFLRLINHIANAITRQDILVFKKLVFKYGKSCVQHGRGHPDTRIFEHAKSFYPIASRGKGTA